MRRSKIHDEFVSLKQRPMTSHAVCYRIELAIAKTFMPGLASQILQLDIQTFLPKVFPLKNLVSRQKVHRHTFIQMDLWLFIFSKMAATVVGSTWRYTYTRGQGHSWLLSKVSQNETRSQMSDSGPQVLMMTLYSHSSSVMVKKESFTNGSQWN